MKFSAFIRPLNHILKQTQCIMIMAAMKEKDFELSEFGIKVEDEDDDFFKQKLKNDIDDLFHFCDKLKKLQSKL